MGQRLLYIPALLDTPMYPFGRVDGQVEFLPQIADCLDMIGMIVGDQNRHDLAQVDLMILQHLLDGADTDAGIDQQSIFWGA